MSMYTQLLRQALDDAQVRHAEMTAGQLLANLLRCRSELLETTSAIPGRSGSLGVVATELAYDVALVGFARQLGIGSGPEAFDPPRRERAQLEQALSSSGVDLNNLEKESQPN